MCGGLEAAITSPMVSAVSAIHVCLDSLSVAQAAGSIPNGARQGAFKRFRDIAKSWQDKGKVMKVQWIPSHSGLKGYEIADSEARRFAQIPHNLLVEKTHTLTCVRKSIKSKKDLAWAKEWDNLPLLGSTKLYQELGLKPSSNVKTMPELKLSREVLGWLIAARSGHGHFADYHERFGHEEADKQCRCGQRRRAPPPFPLSQGTCS